MDNNYDITNIRIINANDVKILYIFTNNNFPDFSIRNQYNKVTNITNIACKARFALLTDIFIAKSCKLSSLKVDKFYII